jgi:hypothetical protein
MEIAQYIADLVQSQREVGIAGLGTVYKKKAPGRYDAATHSFLPPSYSIAFKEEVAEQQSLSNHIALQQNLSREAADLAIAAFAADVQRQLAANGQANLQPLGTLKRENGVLFIDVQQDFSAGLEFFGLPKVDGESLKAENQPVNEPDPIDQVEEVNPLSEVPEVLDTAGIEPENLGEAISEVPEEPVIPEPYIGAPVIEEPRFEVPYIEEADSEEIEPEEPVIEEPAPIETIQEQPASDAPVQEEPVIEEVAPQEPVQAEPEAAVVEVVDPIEEEIIIDNLLEEENPGNETHEPQLIEVPIPPKENSIKYTIHEQPAPQKSDNLLLKVFVSLLVLVILAILAYMFYPKADEQPVRPPAVVSDTTETVPDSVVKMESPKAAQDSAAKLDSVTGTAKVQQSLGDTISKAKLEVKPKVTPKASAADAGTTYEVIGASVLNQKEADWFITQMKRNGITAKVLKNVPGKRLKMSIATLHDETEAKLERDRLEKKLNIKGIYIYRNQKK